MESCEYKEGYKHGELAGYFATGHVRRIEMYEHGKILSGVTQDSIGNSLKWKPAITLSETNPEINQLSQEIMRIATNCQYDSIANRSVSLMFTIDKNGNVRVPLCRIKPVNNSSLKQSILAYLKQYQLKPYRYENKHYAARLMINIDLRNTSLNQNYYIQTDWLNNNKGDHVLNLKYQSENGVIASPAIIDKHAVFPGGKDNLKLYIQKNLKYPKGALKFKKEGKVIVSYVVDKNGIVTDKLVVKSLHPLLDKEVMRVVDLMPRHEPACIMDRPVAVRYSIPINFKLNSLSGACDDYFYANDNHFSDF